MGASKDIARTTVRLECCSKDGTRQSSGTSFLYKLETDDDNWIPLLITNRHVVEDAEAIRLSLSTAPDLLTAGPDDTATGLIDNFQDYVLYHPNPNIDLAAIFLAPISAQIKFGDREFQIRSIGREDLIDEVTERTMRAAENILVAGYPNGIWDTHHNLPVFRSGITATPAILDYKNEPKFLIDCSIFPGSSGSPVFLYNSGVVVDAENETAKFGERFKLLGVVFATMMHTAHGNVTQRPVPTNLNAAIEVGMPNNLGVVVKARELLPLLDLARASYRRAETDGKA